MKHPYAISIGQVTTILLLAGISTISMVPAVTAFSNHRTTIGNPNTLATNVINNTKCQATTNDNDNDTNESAATTKTTRKGTMNPLRLAVLKLGLTELKFTSPLNYEKRVGTYSCANCGTVLFDSKGKYDSGSGWPSFWKSASSNISDGNSDSDSDSASATATAASAVEYKKEWDGRIECACKTCKGHLGHAFPDGPRRIDLPEELLEEIPENDLKMSDPKNPYTRLPRYCINGASLKFQER